MSFYFNSIAHRSKAGTTEVTMTPVLNEDALVELLRLHKIPERFRSVGYYHDDDYAYHFTPIITERSQTP